MVSDTSPVLVVETASGVDAAHEKDDKPKDSIGFRRSGSESVISYRIIFRILRITRTICMRVGCVVTRSNPLFFRKMPTHFVKCVQIPVSR